MSDRISCFVIMPYSAESDRVYTEAIGPALRALQEYNVLTLRADQMGNRAITLKAHVESAVRTSRFCIADLTTANPNVMYELGYAVALEKPVILIRKKGEEQTPANLRDIPLIEYSLDDLDSFRKQLALRCDELAQSILGQSDIPADSEARSSVGVTKMDDVQYLGRLLDSTKARFSALVFSPASLARLMLPQLRNAAARGVLIRIVCTDPESELTRIRAAELGLDVARLRGEMWNDLRELHMEVRAGVDVRITDSQVATSTYLLDDTALTFPYITGRVANSTGFAIRKGTALYSLIKREFDLAWLKARMLSIEGSR